LRNIPAEYYAQNQNQDLSLNDMPRRNYVDHSEVQLEMQNYNHASADSNQRSDKRIDF